MMDAKELFSMRISVGGIEVPFKRQVKYRGRWLNVVAILQVIPQDTQAPAETDG